MSKTAMHRIVLEGRASQRVPGFSLYLIAGTKDVLFEMVGACRTSTNPLDYPDEKYEVFVSKSSLNKDGTEKDQGRKRKVIFSNVSPKEAIEKMRQEVMDKYRDYEVQYPSEWWTPIPEADLEQLRVHNFMRMDSTRLRMDHLAEIYGKDTYAAGLFYDGPRVKAHFCGGDENRVRFDTMAKNEFGIYQEISDALSHAVGDRGPEAAGFLDGTILDGYLVHPGGPNKIGMLLGLDSLQAEAWIMEHGCPKYVATDVIRYKGEYLTKMPWIERQKILGEVISYWKDILGHAIDNKIVEHAPYWLGADKRTIRDWAIANGYQGVRLCKLDGKYNFNGRSWEHVADLAASRYFVLVQGFEDATDTKDGPKGLVGKIRAGQYDNDGVIHDVGVVDPWTDAQRELVSRERQRWMGQVLEVESVGYAKGKETLQKARLVRQRPALRPEHCLFKVTTEAIPI